MPDKSIDYIDSTVYKNWESKLQMLQDIGQDNLARLDASRKLRYAEVDIEAEREAGRLQPDEMFIPQHITDTNIRREQSAYVQYIVQSPRAVICLDKTDNTADMTVLENDLTAKLRYDDWQLSMFSNIDGMEQNGYGVMEVVMDQSTPGNVGHEYVSFADFSFISDTKNIQNVEAVVRRYHYTKTALINLCGDGTDPNNQFSRAQVDKIIQQEPHSDTIESSDAKDASLYPIDKMMFKVRGVVHVAWFVNKVCDDWVRIPRPLMLGRRKMVQSPMMPTQTGTLGSMTQRFSGFNQAPQTATQQPQSTAVPETRYPYIIFPYLISENDLISNLKGRIFLDQDLQEGVTSLVSSTVTQARRAAGLYGSKDTSDPNSDVLQQKNTTIRSGCIMPGNISFHQMDAPDPGMFSAIQLLVSGNQNETSQVNFAVQNRKDSRKTAKEISSAEQQQASLSTVQVALFAIALTQLYRLMTDIIKSRVLTSVITVNPLVLSYYQKDFVVKPSGDVDVIKRQQTLQTMINMWQLGINTTPIANDFMLDMVELALPEKAPKYRQIVNQFMQQQNSIQNQKQQMFMSFAKQMADGILKLSKHKDFFSDIGKLHALPVIENAADQIETLQKQLQQPAQNSQPALTQ